MLQKVGNSINNISKDLLDSVPKLLPGKTVTYELLGGVIDPATGQEDHGSKESFPMDDNIIDPHTRLLARICVFKNSGIKENNILDSAIIKFKLGEEGTPLIGKRFVLYGHNPDDVKAHYFLYLSNMRGGNPHRDPSKQARYKFFDENAEARIQNTVVDRAFEAQVKSREMNVNQLKEFAQAKGWDINNTSNEVLKQMVRGYAANVNTYEDFLEVVSDPDIKLKSDIKIGVDLGVVLYDPVAHNIKGNDGKILATLGKDDSKTFIDLFADWIRTTNDGQKVIADLRKKIAYRIKKQKNPDLEPEGELENA